MTRFCAVVPNYNDGARIRDSLTSLFNQTRPFDEIIIIDDGSVDDSVSIIEDFIKDKPYARLIQHASNKGVVAGLNTGIDACTTDFVLLCSANDTYHSRTVEWCEQALLLHPDAGMVAGDAALSYGVEATKDRPVIRTLPLARETRYYTPKDVIASQRNAPIHFNGGASMLRVSLVKKFGGLLPPMQWHCDWLMYNLIAFSAGFVYVPQAFSTIMLDEKNCYSSNINIWKKEKTVIEYTLRILASSYPSQALTFKQAALLPIFHLGNPLLLLRKEFRWMVTPLLLWRLLTHKLFYGLKYIIPRPAIMQLRTIFKV